MGQTGHQLRPPDISKSRNALILLLSCSERALTSPHEQKREEFRTKRRLARECKEVACIGQTPYREEKIRAIMAPFTRACKPGLCEQTSHRRSQTFIIRKSDNAANRNSCGHRSFYQRKCSITGWRVLGALLSQRLPERIRVSMTSILVWHRWGLVFYWW